MNLLKTTIAVNTLNYSSFISSLVQHLDKNERFVTNQIWINWISVNINITIYYMTKANIKAFHEWSRLSACPGRFLKSMSVTYNLCPIEAGTTGISIVFNHQSQDKIIVYFNWNKWRLDLRGGGIYYNGAFNFKYPIIILFNQFVDQTTNQLMF